MPASASSHQIRQKLKFKCHICPNKQFISKCKLDWHLKCHSRRFQCTSPGCEKSFKQKQHLKSHMLTHVEGGVRPYRCTYTDCGKTFKSISHLKDHTQSVHMRLKPFECAFCGSAFSRQSSLKHHLKHLHANLVESNGQLSEQTEKQLQILRESKTLQSAQPTTSLK